MGRRGESEKRRACCDSLWVGVRRCQEGGRDGRRRLGMMMYEEVQENGALTIAPGHTCVWDGNGAILR